MTERTVGKGQIVKVCQDDYDDSIQLLVIKLSDGSVVMQKREWPHLTYRGESQGSSAHDVYLTLPTEEMSPDHIYDFIDASSRLIEGPKLVPDHADTSNSQEGTNHATE
jgi:hypothetical protein